MEKTMGVDDDWQGAFVLEARLVDLTGEQIGDALAVVEEHTRESGTSATETFGDPVEYARSLAREIGPTAPPRFLGPRDVVAGATGLAGLVLTPFATTAMLTGAPVAVTLGQLLNWLVIAAVLAVLLARPTAALRLVVDAGWIRAAAVGIVFVAALAGLQLLFQQRALELAGPVVVTIAVTCLAVSTWTSWPRDRDLDLIQDPRTGPTKPPTALRWFSALVTPMFAVLIALMTVTLHALV